MLPFALLIAASTCTQVNTSQHPTPTREILEQVVVVGASLSDGFGLSAELGTAVDLGQVLAVALAPRAANIECLANSLFSQAPIENGAKQVEKALTLDASLVIAADFAFWFGYGLGINCDQRMQRLDECLRQLERLKCPILLGDFPDMTRALAGHSPIAGGRALILPQHIPAPSCQEQLNKRLGQWAAQRDNVCLWPMSKFVAALGSEESLEVRANKFKGERKRALMQDDLLHPSSHGASVVSLLILDRMSQVGWLSDEQVTWDADALHKQLVEVSRVARETADMKREQRKARRKRQKADSGLFARPTVMERPIVTRGRMCA
jgi:hypothetical protein